MDLPPGSAAVQARQVAADELVTVLAHDLRNYMSPLKGRLDIVRLRARREGRERDFADLDAAARSLNRLQSLIQDLLDIGRLDQGLFTLSPEPVDLVVLVRDTITMLQSKSVPIVLEHPGSSGRSRSAKSQASAGEPHIECSETFAKGRERCCCDYGRAAKRAGKRRCGYYGSGPGSWHTRRPACQGVRPIRHGARLKGSRTGTVPGTKYHRSKAR